MHAINADAYISELKRQRNDALDRSATLVARNAELERENKLLTDARDKPVARQQEQDKT